MTDEEKIQVIKIYLEMLMKACKLTDSLLCVKDEEGNYCILQCSKEPDPLRDKIIKQVSEEIKRALKEQIGMYVKITTIDPQKN